MKKICLLLLALALLAATPALPFAASPAAGAPLSDAPVEQMAGQIGAGTVLVRFKRGYSEAAIAGVIAAAGASQRETLRLGGIRVLRVPPGAELATVARLRLRAEVASADPDFASSIHAIPNDPQYGPSQWSLPKVNAPAAWDTPQGPGPIVGVIDTGLDYGHPDLAGALQGAGRINSGMAVSAADDNGHGTHVAGIAGANTNNATGVAGVAWTARLLPFKAADSAGRVFGSDWIYGLDWLLDNGARVVNMSFGNPNYSATEQAAIDDAWSRGALLVASAGNDYNSQSNYPASYNNVLSVASVRKDNQRSSFSNYNQYVDLAAPSGELPAGTGSCTEAVISTYLRSKIAGGYALMCGTSQAAPHVAGAAALLLSVYPGLSNAQLGQALVSTAGDLGPAGRDDQYGHGLLNMAAALGAAGQLAGQPPAPTSTRPPAVSTATRTPVPTSTATPTAAAKGGGGKATATPTRTPAAGVSTPIPTSTTVAGGSTPTPTPTRKARR